MSDENCFSVNYYIINDKKILLQFFNKSYPNLFVYKSCWVKLNRNELFKVKNSKLNSIEMKKNKILADSKLKKSFYSYLDKIRI